MRDFTQYLQYIENTGFDELPIKFFDEDWEPIGPSLREDMMNRGLISHNGDTLSLTPGGIDTLNASVS